MEKLYRLEFNKKSQVFHLLEYPKNATNGWTIILDCCTYEEFQLYEDYVYSIPKKKMGLKYLIKCANEITNLTLFLIKYGYKFPEKLN